MSFGIKKKIRNILIAPLFFVRNFLHFCVLKSKKNKEDFRNNDILIIRTDQIGDFLLFAPSFDLIKKKFPESKLVFVGNSCLKDLVSHYESIDEFIPINFKKFKINLLYFWKTINFLKKLNFKSVLYPVYSRSREGDEISSLVFSEEKIAFDGDCCNLSNSLKIINNKFYTKLIKSKHSWLTEIDRNKEFLNFLDIETSKYLTYFNPTLEEISEAKKIIKELNLEENNFVVIFPSAGWHGRVWPFEKFSKIIKLLRDNNFQVVLAGGPKEFFIEEKINYFLDQPIISLIGKTGSRLGVLAAIFSLGRLYFGSDTGPAHLARAVSCPALVILGGGHFGRFFPYGDLEKCQIINKNMSCYNCNWLCIYSQIKCINNIEVNDVWLKIKNMLDIK